MRICMTSNMALQEPRARPARGGHRLWSEPGTPAPRIDELRHEPGGETVITRLADILVIQAIRSWLERDPAARTGWLGALQDAQIVAEPAMQYVTRWRIHLALTWLREDDAALGEMAARLGYRSEAAFSRAFKRFMGVSPGAARRSGDAARSAQAPS